MVPPTLLLTSCRAARPYLTYLSRDEPYLPISPTAYKHTAFHWGKWERKLFIWTTEFGSNSNNHGHDASVPHGFLRRSQATIHQDTQRVKQGSHLGFKLSREMHLTYLPTYLTKSHKGKKELQVDERNSSSFLSARSNNPTRRHNLRSGQRRVLPAALFCGHLIPSREQTTPISTD